MRRFLVLLALAALAPGRVGAEDGTIDCSDRATLRLADAREESLALPGQTCVVLEADWSETTCQDQFGHRLCQVWFGLTFTAVGGLEGSAHVDARLSTGSGLGFDCRFGVVPCRLRQETLSLIELAPGQCQDLTADVLVVFAAHATSGGASVASSRTLQYTYGHPACG